MGSSQGRFCAVFGSGSPRRTTTHHTPRYDLVCRQTGQIPSTFRSFGGVGWLCAAIASSSIILVFDAVSGMVGRVGGVLHPYFSDVPAAASGSTGSVLFVACGTEKDNNIIQ